MLVDLRAFYEHMDLEKLVERATQEGFSKVLTKLEVAGYRAPRIVQQQCRAAAPLWVKAGLMLITA